MFPVLLDHVLKIIRTALSIFKEFFGVLCILIVYEDQPLASLQERFHSLMSIPLASLPASVSSDGSGRDIGYRVFTPSCMLILPNDAK